MIENSPQYINKHLKILSITCILNFYYENFQTYTEVEGFFPPVIQ